MRDDNATPDAPATPAPDAALPWQLRKTGQGGYAFDVRRDENSAARVATLHFRLPSEHAPAFAARCRELEAEAAARVRQKVAERVRASPELRRVLELRALRDRADSHVVAAEALGRLKAERDRLSKTSPPPADLLALLVGLDGQIARAEEELPALQEQAKKGQELYGQARALCLAFAEKARAEARREVAAELSERMQAAAPRIAQAAAAALTELAVAHAARNACSGLCPGDPLAAVEEEAAAEQATQPAALDTHAE